MSGDLPLTNNASCLYNTCYARSNASIMCDIGMKMDKHANDHTTRRSVLFAKWPKCSPQTVKIVEIVVLVFALCIVIGLFSLPVVFHYLVVS